MKSVPGRLQQMLLWSWVSLELFGATSIRVCTGSSAAVLSWASHLLIAAPQARSSKGTEPFPNQWEHRAFQGSVSQQRWKERCLPQESGAALGSSRCGDGASDSRH